MKQLLTEWWEWSDGAERLQLSLLAVIIAFLLGAMGLLVNVMVLMRQRKRQSRRESKLRDMAENAIASWMSDDMDDEALARYFHRLKVQSRLNRRVLTDIVYSTSKLLRSESQAPLQSLFRGLGLEEYCLKLLQHSSWHRQAYAARVLSQLQIQEAVPVLQAKLDTDKMMLRIELISALAAFGDFSGLRLEEQSSTRLSDWEQLLLLERFRVLEISELPQFDEWLHSELPDWVLFGVRLCRYFNRFDKINELGLLLGNPDERIQAAVLEAFEYMGSPEVAPFLLTYVESAKGECLHQTLRLLGSLGDEYAVPVLIDYAGHPDESLRMTAMQALKENGLADEKLSALAGTSAGSHFTLSVS